MTVEQRQQAVTMSAAGHSCNKISQAIGKDRATIKRHLDTPEAIEQVREERTELVELYREKARDCVAAIDDDKIAKASALQLATSSGILLDKSLLLSGKPTQNVAVLIEVLDMLSVRQDEEIERQWQADHARLLAEKSQLHKSSK
jgi:IS30 family transposase